MWQVISARATGTSHAATGAPCQDREAFRIVEDCDGGEAVVAVVCDGAGSAPLADSGAELVCEAIRSLAAGFVADRGSSALQDSDVHAWIADIRRRIEETAAAESAEPRDYACTLVFIIAAERRTFCGQVGDGAVVLNDEDGLHVALWPENGEYANQTFFVSQEDAAAHLRITRCGPIRDFVLFSDGLQRLALDEAQRAPHGAFFQPLLDTVRGADALDATKDQLAAFLSSDRVNAKTDDDKSIVIGCRID
ncbi:MAG TPA: PP2C family serine/threonine-protein phosphatase [Candidatus Baltobacteraceae bacterium]|nr:PP2C family serine/threonine-protein phosphatase [Candidatus Baltobacteraceae bacterium]